MQYLIRGKIKDTSKMNTLNFTTKQINRDFRIKVYGRKEDGQKVDKLMGVSGILAMIGVELLNKQLVRAYKSMDDKCVCKLRRGLVVTYYNK